VRAKGLLCQRRTKKGEESILSTKKTVKKSNAVVHKRSYLVEGKEREKEKGVIETRDKKGGFEFLRGRLVARLKKKGKGKKRKKNPAGGGGAGKKRKKTR